MMVHVNHILEDSLHMFVTGDSRNMQQISAMENYIDQLERSLHTKHIMRLSEGKCSAESGLVFIDVLGAVEQIAYRSRKIADHMCEKRGE